MALALYLVIVDGNNRQLVGSGTPTGLTNPFRNNVAVSQPLLVTDSTFGGTETPGTQGGAGAPDLTDLEVTLPDDSITPAVFRQLVSGGKWNTFDVLAVSTGQTPKVVSGFGLSTVLITSLERTISTAGVQVKIGASGQLISVGSAPKLGNSYQPFTFVTYDQVRRVVT